MSGAEDLRRRQCKRYTKRLETTFSSGGLFFRGISSDLSAGGLFIRTQHGFVPGTIVDVEVYLPNNTVARLKGIVRRTVKTTMPGVKNGMGIELIERDANYLEFLRTVVNERGSEEEGFEEYRDSPIDYGQNAESEKPCGEDDTAKDEKPPESIIVICGNCNVKNRVPVERRSGLKCGKCGAPLMID